jgi:hypothetical protein
MKNNYKIYNRIGIKANLFLGRGSRFKVQGSRFKVQGSKFKD